MVNIPKTTIKPNKKKEDQELSLSLSEQKENEKAIFSCMRLQPVHGEIVIFNKIEKRRQRHFLPEEDCFPTNSSTSEISLCVYFGFERFLKLFLF